MQHSLKSIDCSSYHLKMKKTEYLYTSKIEIKYLNVLIDGKGFFDVPVKNKEEAYKNILRLVKIMITQLVIY